MSELKLKKILSFSSEDDIFKADNLLNGKKWLGSKDQCTKQYVIIELNEPSEIRQIEIENDSSASIEVQACHGVDDDFTTILSPVSFMSMSESKNQLNTTRLKVFTDEANLAPDTLDTKWNKVQIICTQPFNPALQFGLSSIKFFPQATLSDEIKEAAKINTGIFSLKKDLIENLNVSDSDKAKNLTRAGSLFEKYKNTDTNQTEATEKSKPTEKENDTNQVETEKKQEPESNSRKPNIFARPGEKTTIKQPKNQTLRGVIFALSGFQNPERAEIRDRGLKLGAKYRPDWTDDCTHLVCAFPNTPKANLVREKGGKIVTKEWLDECEKDGKLIDWEEFKMESKSDDDDESKPRKAARKAKRQISKLKRKDDLDDSYDEEEAENSDDRDFIVNSSEEDEEDEIMDLDDDLSDGSESFDSDDSEKVKKKNKKRKATKKDKKKPKKKKTKHQSSSSSSSSSSEESDKEENKKKRIKKREEKNKIDKKTNNKENVFAVKKKEIEYENESEEEKNQANNKKLDKKLSVSSDKTEINSDSDITKDTKNEQNWELPDFFEGKNFYIYGNFDQDKRKLLERSIIGFAGNLENYMNDNIDYVITNKSWNDEFKQSKQGNKKLIILKHDWIIECTKKRKFEPYESYEIKSN